MDLNIKVSQVILVWYSTDAGDPAARRMVSNLSMRLKGEPHG